MRLPAGLLAVSVLASSCAATDEPDGTAPSGLYHLEMETVSDDCAPARSTRSASGLPVLASPRSVTIVYPQGPAGDAPAPWARATALRRAAAPTLHEDLGCPGASSTLELAIDAETATSIEVDLIETWSGLATCTAPDRPAADCRSERLLRFDLEEACEPPCELVLDACSDAACPVDEPTWRCTCDESLL